MTSSVVYNKVEQGFRNVDSWTYFLGVRGVLIAYDEMRFRPVFRVLQKVEGLSPLGPRTEAGAWYILVYFMHTLFVTDG